MTAVAERSLSSNQVCELLDITYRQADYVCRRLGLALGSRGSGYRRRWDDATIERLAVARALLDAVGHTPRGRSPWPNIVDAVLAGPPPVPGWVTLSPDRTVTYHGPVPIGVIGLTAIWQPPEVASP